MAFSGFQPALSAVSSYRPGADFQERMSVAADFPMKVLSANQYTSRTSASVFALNGIPCFRLESLFRTSYAAPAAGAIIPGGFPVRAASSGSVSGRKGGGNFLGTPARRKIDSNSVGQNS